MFLEDKLHAADSEGTNAIAGLCKKDQLKR